MNFKKWLESVAVQNDKQLSPSTGNGGDDIYNNNDDDDGNNDDDYENGPWGWNKMQGFNLKLFEWAKTSPAMKQIQQIFCQYLFGEHPKTENVRVFPSHVQVEVEWEFDTENWSEFDNQIEAVLKRSDIYRPLGITQDKVWDVVDRGAVYDYTLYVIIMTLTSRMNGGYGVGKTSYMDNQAGFYTWEYIRKDWDNTQKEIMAHIQEFFQENGLGQANVELTPGRGMNKPTGLAQSMGGTKMWAKGIVHIPYKTLSQHNQENPDVWDNWGNERPIGRYAQQDMDQQS